MKNLSDLTQLAIRAHNYTSFDPEKRGNTIIAEFQDILNNDLAEIQASDQEQKEKYILKFRSLFTAWLHAKSNCISSMITGPAKFPTQKAERANNREHGHYEAFMCWRSKAKKAILKSLEPEKTFSSELERYKKELSAMKANHELMKEGNRRIKEAHKNNEDISDYLKETFGIKPHMIAWTIKFGFGLQNNNANMKRVEDRIKILESKESQQGNENKEILFDGGRVVLNYSIDRIMIIHDNKPEYSVLSELKHGGFHWSPTNKAWIRKITRDAIYKAESLTKTKIEAC